MTEPSVLPRSATGSIRVRSRSVLLHPAVTLGVILLATVLRVVGLRDTYELFIDEITYSRISESVATGHGVAFFGEPFYLHPPLFFFEQALYLHLFGVSADVVSLVLDSRPLNVVFGVGSVLVVLQVLRRVTGPGTALAAALLFAANPFTIRFDSRVFLEPSAVLYLLVGYGVLLAARPLREVTARRAVVAGGFFGLALLSKETSAALYGVPLLLCVLLDGPLPRQRAVQSLAALVVVYLPYPVLATVLTGPDYIDGKTSGVRRLLGLEQSTGFNAQGAPSIVSRVISHPEFFLTYAVFAVGVPATVWLLRRQQTGALRLLGLFSVTAYAQLFLQTAFGTIEEQMYYYLFPPALLACAAWVHHLTARQQDPVGRRVATATAAVLLVVCGGFWVQFHRTPDDALVQVLDQTYTSVPAGAKVEALMDTMQLTLPYYRVFVDTEPAALAARQADYAITSSLQVEQGYGYARERTVTWLQQHAQPVFQAEDRSNGTITLWRLDGASAVGEPPGLPTGEPLGTDPGSQRPVGGG